MIKPNPIAHTLSTAVIRCEQFGYVYDAAVRERSLSSEDGSTAIPVRRTLAAAKVPLVPALTIVSHPDSRRVGERALLTALSAGREVALSRSEPDFVLRGRSIGTPLRDPFLSRRPIQLACAGDGGILITGDGVRTVGAETMHEAMRLSPAALTTGVPLVLAERIVLLLHLIDCDLDGGGDSLEMVGCSNGIARVRNAVRRLADLTVPVLLRGETGTGKERVAQALHAHSPRRDGPFISVNLGAIPKDLAAAELFGATRGAFTGAVRDREGFFAAARGGTLFLDEVGEAPLEVQAILLRVLETGEMYPIGGHKPVAVDVRLIAATDANLEDQIRAGRFKAPLLHRLAGYEIHLPPLRERREDIGVLLYHFARQELTAIGEADRLLPMDPLCEPWLPAELALQLLRFAWPGNIRQLRNIVRQMVIGSRGLARLQLDPRLAVELEAGACPEPSDATQNTDAPRDIACGSTPDLRPPTSTARTLDREKPRRRPSDVTEQELLAALREASWDLKAASDRLGVPRPSMYDLIERCPGIRTVGDLSADEIERSFAVHSGDLDRMVEQLQVSRRGLRRRLGELGLGVRKADR